MNPEGLRSERFQNLKLPSGLTLEAVNQAFRLEGTPDPDGGNVILLFHSLTGGADPRQWWPELVVPGGVLDPSRWTLLTPNLLGSCYGTWARMPGRAVSSSAFEGDAVVASRPVVASSSADSSSADSPGFHAPGLEGQVVEVRDMVYLTGLLLDRLGIPRVRLATGGSLGGMATLEWAASFPNRAESAVVFAAPAAHTAQAIGFSRIQRALLRLGGPEEGLALAREAAMLTYRTAHEFEVRFGRTQRPDGLFQIESYLENHGRKLVERFHAESYRILVEAMDRHDVGEGRGGMVAALRAFTGHLTGVGIPGDLLYTPEDVQRWTDAIGATYREIHSLRGHDAFLLESDQAGAILAEALQG